VQSNSFHDSQPYGASVFGKQLENFFPEKNVRNLIVSDLEHYYPFINQSETDPYFGGELPQVYLEDSIEDALYALEDYEVKRFNLIGFYSSFYMTPKSKRAFWMHIYQGNHALILADKMEKDIQDFLDIEVNFRLTSILYDKNVDSLFTIQTPDGQLTALKPFDSFTKIDSLPENAEVIAQNQYGDVVGVSIPVGEGKVTYFSLPVAFANYNLLKRGTAVTETILKQLPVEDSYYFSFIHDSQSTNRNTPSILSFIHSNKALSWAFYTLLFSIFLFMLFQIRRKQRIIPVINSPQNMSLKFTETLGNLYLMHNNHRDVALKKMNYFLAHIRQEYNLDSTVVNDDFYKRLHLKTGIAEKVIKRLFLQYFYIKARHEITQEEFLKFCALLQHFKK
jgi:hypothetical protein